MSLRLTSVGRIAKPPLRTLEPGERAEPKERRRGLLRGGGRLRRLPDLRPLRARRRARAFAGPAIVEEFDSTTVVHPGFAVRVDDVGNLIIEKEHA